jgi:hypothetical protein
MKIVEVYLDVKFEDSSSNGLAAIQWGLLFAPKFLGIRVTPSDQKFNKRWRIL